MRFKKGFFIFVLIFIFAMFMLPSSAIAYDYGGVTYDDNDYTNFRRFEFASAVDGKTNGQCLNASYNANDPTTWTGVTWEENRVKTIDFVNKSLDGDLI
jgi:hypothetical protein